MARFAAELRADGFYVAGDSALLVTTFSRDGQAVATLQLEGRLASARRGLGESLRVLTVIFVVLMVVGAVLSRVLQRAITGPIIRLAQTARNVRTSENYALRAEITTEDELGELGRRFNEMLGGIEERDRRLVEGGAFQNAILTSSGVAVISTDPVGIVRTFNPAAERLLGYSSAEVTGRASPRIWHDPEEVAARGREQGAELGTDAPVGFEVLATDARRDVPSGREWTFIRKDGCRVPVDLVVSAMRDARGGIIGYCGLATDLTERKGAVEALSASEHRYSVVVDQTGQMVYDFDFATGLNRWFGTTTVQTITGYMLEEFQAVTLRGWSKLIHPEDRARALEEFERCLAAGLRYDSLYRFRRKDGSYRTLQDFGVFLRGADGRVLRMLGAMADVTERMEAEASIHRLNASLERRVEERTAELAGRVGEVERLNAEQRELMRIWKTVSSRPIAPPRDCRR